MPQLPARGDSCDAEDLLTIGGETDCLFPGFNNRPAKVSELQANYVIEVDDDALKHNQWLLNLKIVF